MANWIGSSVNLGNAETKTLGDIGVGTQDRIVGLVKSDQAVTVHILESIDGGKNFDKDTTVAVVANTVKEIDVNPIYGNTVRITVTNGATPTTFFRFGAKLVSAGAR